MSVLIVLILRLNYITGTSIFSETKKFTQKQLGDKSKSYKLLNQEVSDILQSFTKFQ